MTSIRSLRNPVVLIVIVAAVATITIQSAAMVIRIPSHAEIFRNSDLILIAEMLDASDTQVIHPEHPYLRMMTTRFRVLSVLRGDYKGKEISIAHWRYRTAFFDGPGTIEFSRNRDSLIFVEGDRRRYMESVGPPQFLLYLIKKGEMYKFANPEEDKYSAYRLIPQ